MYIEVYNRNLDHVTNITDIKYNIIRRVFDLDTALLEGVATEDVSEGFIFVLCEDSGNYVYSGYMNSINQKQSHVSFKGLDFKSIYDTEILLDYSQSLVDPSEFTTISIYTKVSDLVIEQHPDNPISVEINVVDNDTLFIANYIGQYLIENAKSFLKVYLAYFKNYISPKFNRVTKTIDVKFKESSVITDMRLDDFIFEKSTADININSAVATIKFETLLDDNKFWILSTEKYYNSLPLNSKMEGAGVTSFIQPVEFPENYDFGFAYKAENPDYPGIIMYWQVANNYISRPVTLPYKVYYLGKDNKVYEENISLSNKYLPVKTKIFEHEFFNSAQVAAITELVNSRYNENITLINTKTPIDLKVLELFQTVKIYDKNGDIKELPLSEIEISNYTYRVKLGFKKTLFTEVIKK